MKETRDESYHIPRQALRRWHLPGHSFVTSPSSLIQHIFWILKDLSPLLGPRHCVMTESRLVTATENLNHINVITTSAFLPSDTQPSPQFFATSRRPDHHTKIKSKSKALSFTANHAKPKKWYPSAASLFWPWPLCPAWLSVHRSTALRLPISPSPKGSIFTTAA